MIRPLTSQDGDLVADFMKDWNASDRSPGFFWTGEELRQEIGQGMGLGAFADDGRLLAVLLWRELAEAAEVIVIATQPRARGQGWGMKLLNAARLKRPGKPWWLEVHEGNFPAQALYQSLGFQVDGRRPRYFRDGGAALLMSWKPSVT